MAINYSIEDTQYIIDQYKNDPNRETVDRLAQELEKSAKSIIGKLSREGVYQKTEYLTKTGEKPVTKREIVEKISEIVGISYQTLAGLEKSPKASLKALEESLIINLRPEEFK